MQLKNIQDIKAGDIYYFKSGKSTPKYLIIEITKLKQQVGEVMFELFEIVSKNLTTQKIQHGLFSQFDLDFYFNVERKNAELNILDYI